MEKHKSTIVLARENHGTLGYCVFTLCHAPNIFVTTWFEPTRRGDAITFVREMRKVYKTLGLRVVCITSKGNSYHKVAEILTESERG